MSFMFNPGASMVRYGKKVTNDWEFEDIASGARNDIAVSVTGVAHVAFFDNSNFQLMYANNAAGTWDIELVDDGGDGPGGDRAVDNPAIAVDSQRPYRIW